MPGKVRKSRKRKPGTAPRLRRWGIRALVVFLLISLVPVMILRWVPPPSSAVILQRTLTERAAQDYQWVPLARISPDAALAVVAAEDQKFPHHRGFDLKAIWNAVQGNARGEPLKGASTLTQQVARNLFLWQGRSYLRKALEAWMTILLEALWPKHRILEVYLNIAEMGDRTFGVQAASQRFFSRPASAIDRRQAALLAAVLPSPRRYRADRPSAYVLERRDWIMQQMSQLGGDGYLKAILP